MNSLPPIIGHRFDENGLLEVAFERNPNEYISETVLDKVEIDNYINSIAQQLNYQNLKSNGVQTQLTHEVFKEISDFSDDCHVPTKIHEINSEFGTTNVSIDRKSHTEDISTKTLLLTCPNLFNDYFISLNH